MMAAAVRSKAVPSFYRRIGGLLVQWSRRALSRGREPAPIEPSPTHTDLFNEAAKKPIDLTAEFGKAAGSGEAEGGAAGEAAREPAPEAEVKIARRRRARDHS